MPIELPELTKEQVQEFARQYGLAEDSSLVDPLMQLVGGHPYLLQQAFSHLKSYPDTTLEQLLAEARTDAGIYRHHLREFWLSLQQEPKLMAAFEKACRGGVSPPSIVLHSTENRCIAYAACFAITTPIKRLLSTS